MKILKLLSLPLLTLLAACSEYEEKDINEMFENPSYFAMSFDIADVAAWEDHSRHDQYTSYAREGIELYGQDLLSSEFHVDDSGFCSNYNNLNREERMDFWIMMVSSIAQHESKFDTNARYLENNGQYSRGLLQLGYESTKGYRCGFTNQHQINESPRRNLHCGVRILNHWIKRDRMIRNETSRDWKGVARYWSVVRFEIWPAPKRNELLGIKRNTNSLEFCN